MNLLGMYSDSDSGESDDEKPSLPQPSAPRPLPSSSSSSFSSSSSSSSSASSSNKNLTKKKKKKLDISFLPENIQAALTRGGDDSSDDEDMLTSKASSHSHTSGTRSSQAPPKSAASALFSLLPKPTRDNDVAITSSANITKQNVSKQDCVVPEIKSDSSSGGDSSDENDSESDDEKLVSNPLKTDRPSAESLVVPTTDSKAESSSRSSGVGVPLAGPVFSNSALAPSSLPCSTQPPNPLPCASQYLNGQPSTQPMTSPYHHDISGHQHQLQQPGHYNQQDAQYQYQVQQHQLQQQFYQQQQQFQQQQQLHQQSQHQESYDSQTIPKNSRKREREIQNHLLNGDVSAAMGLGGASIKDFHRDTTWDDSRYREQQQRQEELQTMFGNPKGDKMIAQPTKNQNRKHHINSMVFSAAEAELELLEARGRQSKSKSETQGKYGW